MRVLSLCSGYGGLDLAVESVLGAETVAYAEIDKKAASVFARHWPDVPNLGDLTAVDWGGLENVDVVTAGFPCQDLSYAGKGAGIVKDSRSGLWYAIEHALGVLRPRYVCLENVSAIVARRPGLDVVLAGLARLGFDAEWTCLRAADVGAPHGRNRWFLVAHAQDVGRERSGRARGWGARPTDNGEPPADTQSVGRTEGWTGTDGRRSAASGAPPTPDTDQPSGEARHGRPGAGDAGRSQPVVGGDTTPADTTGTRGQDRPGQPDARGPLVGAVTGTGGGDRPGHPSARVRELGGSAGVAWGDYAPAIHRWATIIGRPAPPPTDERGRLSPHLVEWMMGLPAGWVTDTPGLSRADMLKILGNGVVPQQAAAAVSALLQLEERAA